MGGDEGDEGEGEGNEGDEVEGVEVDNENSIYFTATIDSGWTEPGPVVLILARQVLNLFVCFCGLWLSAVALLCALYYI